MNRHANYFKIGVFVLAGFFLVAGALIYLGAGRMFRPRFYVETYVDGTVQGVDIGSAVKFRGVTIGRVSEVGFTFNVYSQPDGKMDGRRDYVVVVLEVENQAFHGLMNNSNLNDYIEKMVSQGLRVMIQPQGITGLNFVELDYLSADRQTHPLQIWWTPENPYIPSAPGTLTSMLDSINSIMDTVKGLDIKDVMGQLHTALGRANSTLVELSNKLDQVEPGKVSADLRSLIADTRAKVNELQAAELSSNGHKALEAITKAAHDAGQMTERAEVLVDKIQTNPLLNPDEIGAIVGDFRAAAANVRTLTENLREYPSQLFLGEPPKRSPFDPANKTKPRR